MDYGTSSKVVWSSTLSMTLICCQQLSVEIVVLPRMEHLCGSGHLSCSNHPPKNRQHRTGAWTPWDAHRVFESCKCTTVRIGQGASKAPFTYSTYDLQCGKLMIPSLLYLACYTHNNHTCILFTKVSIWMASWIDQDCTELQATGMQTLGSSLQYLFRLTWHEFSSCWESVVYFEN